MGASLSQPGSDRCEPSLKSAYVQALASVSSLWFFNPSTYILQASTSTPSRLAPMTNIPPNSIRTNKPLLRTKPYLNVMAWIHVHIHVCSPSIPDTLEWSSKEMGQAQKRGANWPEKELTRLDTAQEMMPQR